MRPRALTDLPQPDPESRATSQALAGRIGRRIDAAGGWIGFDEYMAMALYEPGLGYYANGRPVFGTAGDFVTAPGVSALFGATLARQLAAWLSDPVLGGAGAGPGGGRYGDGDGDGGPGAGTSSVQVVEFGAGTGALAADLLPALAALGHPDVPYRIIEPSAPLRERQRQTIAERAPAHVARVQWLDRLPEAIRGVVVANEVLDAMPFRVVRWDGAHWQELGVARAGDAGADDGALDRRAAGDDAAGDPADSSTAFAWAARPAGAALCALLPDEAGGPAAQRATGWRIEVAPQVDAWVRTVAGALHAGALLLIDYGFASAEYHRGDREGGTLAVHYRHRTHDDPFVLPGLQDITAHVDFGRVAGAAREAGLQLLGYTSQARFLLNAGLLDVLQQRPRDDRIAWLRDVQAVQTLMSEGEMGEVFKAIAFGRGLQPGAWAPGFAESDRSASLQGG